MTREAPWFIPEACTCFRRMLVAAMRRSPLHAQARVPPPALPLTLSLSPSGGEGIETAPSPSERERVGVRGADLFTHNAG